MSDVEVDPGGNPQAPRDRSGGASAAALELSAAQQEIEDLKRALQETERELRLTQAREKSLTGELQHRVRNMLAVVRSVFSRTADAYDVVEEVADHFQGRLDALARSQTRMFDAELGIELEDILRDELLAAAAADDPRVTLRGPAVRLIGNTAQVLGLAMHELVTNSIKFGVLSLAASKGNLLIEWSLVEERLDFVWKETGVTVISSAPLRIGFGREFIEKSLPYQTDAATSFVIRPGAIICRIQVRN
jgi:two-component sensor histidine kinase